MASYSTVKSRATTAGAFTRAIVLGTSSFLPPLTSPGEHAAMVEDFSSPVVSSPTAGEIPCASRRVKALVDGESVPCDSVEEKIQRLADIWKRYNSGRSVTEYNHAAYMQVIGIGMEAIPALLRRLEAGDGDWIVAMRYITGENVTTPAMRGDFAAIKQAWLEWGRDNGFRK